MSGKKITQILREFWNVIEGDVDDIFYDGFTRDSVIAAIALGVALGIWL